MVNLFDKIPLIALNDDLNSSRLLNLFVKISFDTYDRLDRMLKETQNLDPFL